MFLENNDSNDELMNEINMIPLIDVMLVLLIVFIITAPVMHHIFKLELPQEAAIQQQLTSQTIQIAVEADGQYRWNSDYVSEEELINLFQQVASQDPKPEFHLHADKNTRYEQIMHIISLAQRAGLTKIGFVTIPGTAT